MQLVRIAGTDVVIRYRLWTLSITGLLISNLAFMNGWKDHREKNGDQDEIIISYATIPKSDMPTRTPPIFLPSASKSGRRETAHPFNESVDLLINACKDRTHGRFTCRTGCHSVGVDGDVEHRGLSCVGSWRRVHPVLAGGSWQLARCADCTRFRAHFLFAFSAHIYHLFDFQKHRPKDESL